jgi:hypothetical protein
VTLSVNGEPIDDFVFVESSYPWGGIQAVVPQAVAERGPLSIELVTEGGRAPPSHLPGDLGVGLDFVEVRPLSEAALLMPTVRQWVGWFLFLISGFVFLRFLRLGPRATAVGILTLAVILTAMTAVVPTIAARSLAFGWLVLPACMLLLWSAELAERFSIGREMQQQEHQ